MKAVTPSGHFHAVRFYEDDKSLCRIVSGFIAEGLALDQPALIIATQPHIDSIVENLVSATFDVKRLQDRGDVLLLDAREMLATFMVNGQPDPDFFRGSAGRVLTQVARGRTTTIRAYGEMVDVLWKDGMNGAAIRLEMLWNHLANTHEFSLLCGYAMGNFYKNASVDDVCRHHTHKVSDDGQAARLSWRPNP
jgi:MEDS: MEthanogen/methylotroph, DcmR Sensory domain